jgi:hypothetical protein
MDSPATSGTTDSRIRARFRLRLDDFPSSFHACDGWRFLRSLAGRHFSARASFHELPHGRDDAGHDACHEGDTKQPQSSFTDVLVRDVHGTPNGFHRCLPNELVVSRSCERGPSFCSMPVKYSPNRTFPGSRSGTRSKRSFPSLLVANHLKHGMMTVRKRDQAKDKKSNQEDGKHHQGAIPDSGNAHGTPTTSPHHKSSDHSARQPSAGRKGAMTLLSFVVLGAGLAIAW